MPRHCSGTTLAIGRGVDCIEPETEHQKRRFENALTRREARKGETERKKRVRKSLETGWYA